jgi:hypothetical protein
VTSYYSPVVEDAYAVAELASQIQDHAIEAFFGQPLPPCPDHPHPLSPGVANDVAVWQGPRNPDHHREPIEPQA